MRVAPPCFLRETHYINYCMLQHALGARSTTARNSMRWINYCMPQHVLGSGSCGYAPSLLVLWRVEAGWPMASGIILPFEEKWQALPYCKLLEGKVLHTFFRLYTSV